MALGIESLEGLKWTIEVRKGALESKRMRMNVNKTKMTIREKTFKFMVLFYVRVHLPQGYRAITRRQLPFHQQVPRKSTLEEWKAE